MKLAIYKDDGGIWLMLDGVELLCVEKTTSKIYRYISSSHRGIRVKNRVIEEEE